MALELIIEPASSTGDDYVYDANGNMTVDQNKGILTIAYNHLNLPSGVFKGPGERVQYTYDATGRKLRQTSSLRRVSAPALCATETKKYILAVWR